MANLQAVIAPPAQWRRGWQALCVVVMLAVTGVHAARAQPVPAASPAAKPPPGLLSVTETRQRPQFLRLAAAGNIDVAFFGDSDMEFWLWQDRGLRVWNQKFDWFRPVNFGAQGTWTRSLLWRLQNGELDGYQAKVIVMNVLGPADLSHSLDANDVIAAEAALLAEIRQRQPQAKVVLVANFRDKLIPELAAINAGVAKLADGKAVVFLDINQQLQQPDGSFKPQVWSLGMQRAGYELWADALLTWFDRFVH